MKIKSLDCAGNCLVLKTECGKSVRIPLNKIPVIKELQADVQKIKDYLNSEYRKRNIAIGG